jgi:hypothetical protein
VIVVPVVVEPAFWVRGWLFALVHRDRLGLLDTTVVHWFVIDEFRLIKWVDWGWYCFAKDIEERTGGVSISGVGLGEDLTMRPLWLDLNLQTSFFLMLASG